MNSSSLDCQKVLSHISLRTAKVFARFCDGNLETYWFSFLSTLFSLLNHFAFSPLQNTQQRCASRTVITWRRFKRSYEQTASDVSNRCCEQRRGWRRWSTGIVSFAWNIILWGSGINFFFSVSSLESFDWRVDYIISSSALQVSKLTGNIIKKQRCSILVKFPFLGNRPLLLTPRKKSVVGPSGALFVTLFFPAVCYLFFWMLRTSTVTAHCNSYPLKNQVIWWLEFQDVGEPSVQLRLKVKNPDTGAIEPTVMTVTADKFRVLLSGTYQVFFFHFGRLGISIVFTFIFLVLCKQQKSATDLGVPGFFFFFFFFFFFVIYKSNKWILKFFDNKILIK